MKTGLIGLAVGAMIVFGIMTATKDDTPRVPKCQEDEWVDGEGDFSHGYWSEYICLSE